jgi:hypothetical protein
MTLTKKLDASSVQPKPKSNIPATYFSTTRARIRLRKILFAGLDEFRSKGGFIMPLQQLIPSPNPARDDVQQTDLTYDVIGRYICNNWQEITAAQGPGSYPFDVVVIGAGMFGTYCAEKLYRLGGASASRILLLDAGAFLLQSHIQNLPPTVGWEDWRAQLPSRARRQH